MQHSGHFLEHPGSLPNPSLAVLFPSIHGAGFFSFRCLLKGHLPRVAFPSCPLNLLQCESLGRKASHTLLKSQPQRGTWGGCGTAGGVVSCPQELSVWGGLGSLLHENKGFDPIPHPQPQHIVGAQGPSVE